MNAGKKGPASIFYMLRKFMFTNKQDQCGTAESMEEGVIFIFLRFWDFWLKFYLKIKLYAAAAAHYIVHFVHSMSVGTYSYTYTIHINV